MNNARMLSSEYGTFRTEIQDYFKKAVLKEPLVIFDPMAGTAPLIPFVETHGHIAYFNDIQPIHLFINEAKTYRVFQEYTQKGYEWYVKQLLDCMSPLRGKSLCISGNWIDDSVLHGLIQAWQATERHKENTATLLRAVILLCVRPLSSITRSRNPTWFKFGGISSNKSLRDIIRESLARFDRYYSYYNSKSVRKQKGKCIFTNKNAAELILPQKVDLILTSPPYCNRLDAIIQYGPENYFLAALGHFPPDIGLIGTTKVRDYDTLGKDFEYLTKKSKYASRFLNKIKKSPKADDPGYYLKYYTRYFAELFIVTDKAVNNLSSGGKIYFVTQDNIHRGQLIEPDKVLRELFAAKGWKSKTVRRWERHHLGLQTVSREHAFVVPKQAEKVVVMWQ